MYKFDILEVVSSKIPLEKKGNNYVSKCPFHSEDTASFVVSPEKGIFTCFGCGVHGNAVKFISLFEHISVEKAYEKLCREHGLAIDIPPKKKENEFIFKTNEFVKNFMNSCLKKSNKCLNYLSKRKIDEELINEFSIGYSEKYIEPTIKAGHIILDLLDSGLLNSKKGEFFQERICLPIRNIDEDIIGFVGRTIKQNESIKYLNTKDTVVFKKSSVLFNIDKAIKNIGTTDAIYVVEGVFDVLSLYKCGIKNVVCTLGCQINKQQIEELKQHAKKIIICYDSDKAGIRASIKAYRLIKSMNVDSKFVLLTKGKDPNEILINFSENHLSNMIKNTLDFYDYLLAIYSKNNLSQESKIYFQKELFNLLSLENSLQKKYVLNKWSQLNNLKEKEVIKDFYDYISLEENKILFYNLFFIFSKNKNFFLKKIQFIPKSCLKYYQKKELNQLFLYFKKENNFEKEKFINYFPYSNSKNIICEWERRENFYIEDEKDTLIRFITKIIKD